MVFAEKSHRSLWGFSFHCVENWIMLKSKQRYFLWDSDYKKDIMVKKEEFYYLSADQNTKIHTVEWMPHADPVAVLQVAHGITEHILRYEEVAEYFTKQGIVVVGNDHLGHGSSIAEQSDFMYCKKWDNLVEDVHTLQQMQRKKYPDIPYYMLGFSLGSFVVRNYLSKYPEAVDAVILMGTGMTPQFQIALAHMIVKKEAGKIGEKNSSPLIQQLSFETYNKNFKPNQTSCDWLCKDKDGLENYINDEVCGKIISAGLFRELLHGMAIAGKKETIMQMNKELPVRLISGDEDPVGEHGKGVDRVLKVFKKAGMERISMKLYPGRHDILHEACKDIVLQDITEWIFNEYKR